MAVGGLAKTLPIGQQDGGPCPAETCVSGTATRRKQVVGQLSREDAEIAYR
jgi:hypothetical protein